MTLSCGKSCDMKLKTAKHTIYCLMYNIRIVITPVQYTIVSIVYVDCIASTSNYVVKTEVRSSNSRYKYNSYTHICTDLYYLYSYVSY